jgi:hypothetical protein
MNPTALPAAVEPEEWTLVFHREASSRWFSFIALGRFKHVSAFAYLPGLKGWVIHDWQHGGLRVAVLPHSDEACRLITSMFGGPTTEWVKVRRAPAPPSWTGFRLGSCVGAVKHLLGIPGNTLRPDALYRHLVRHGIVTSAIPAAGAGPAADNAAAAGQG